MIEVYTKLGNIEKSWELEECEDVDLITEGLYKTLVLNFPKLEFKDFGVLINTKGHKYFLIKEVFQKQLEEAGWL